MKKILCSVVAAATLFTSSAFAATLSPYNVSAIVDPNIQVQIDGIVRDFYHANGYEVFPITYNHTTYLPIRAIGEIMGKNVNWDSTTNTATIAGVRTSQNTVGVPNNTAAQTQITMECRPDYTIVIDSTARTFYDSYGNVTYPMVYNGSIYLPLRAIGEIMGKNVGWNEATQTASLSGSSVSTGGVTDFDTNNSTNTGNVNTGNTNTGNTATNITLEQAKQIALNHAGKAAAEVQFVKAQTDWDNGMQEYEIEFIIISGNIVYEYDYEITLTGTIKSYDYDAESYTHNSGNGNFNTNIGSNVAITEAQAKQIALSKVSGASEANIVRCKLDYDDGRYEYEVKIIYGTLEYEISVNANTGSITDYDVDSIYD